MGNLQPLTLPDTLDPLVVDCPARLAQQFGDLAIAIAAVLPGKLDNIGCETLLVVSTAWDLALRRAMLPERRTGATLGDMQLRSHLLNAGTVLTGLMLGYTLLAFGTAFEVIKGDPKLVVERCELVSKVVRLTTGSDPI